MEQIERDENRRKWTKEQVDLLKRNYFIESDSSLARMLKKTSHLIKVKCEELIENGELKDKNREFTEEEKEYIEEQAKKESIYTIAKELTLNPYNVLKHLKNKELLPFRKWTPEEESELKRMWMDRDISRYLIAHVLKRNVREVESKTTRMGVSRIAGKKKK